MSTYIVPALRSVATVGATAAVGAYARYRGVLTASGVKVLEKAVSEIFTPALILLKVLPNDERALHWRISSNFLLKP